MDRAIDDRRAAMPEVRLESTDGSGKAAEVWVEGTLLTVMDEYSPPGGRLTPGVLDEVQFVYLTDEAFTWEEAVRGNPGKRRTLEPVRLWSYVGYGQVLQIMPVVVDYGLLTMSDANWTTDEGLVGKYVRVPIDRLSIRRRQPPDWPTEAR